MKHRAYLPAQERKLRSRLIQLLRSGGVVRGNLVTMRNTCGKPNCRCQRGQRHESLYLAQSRKGKHHMQYVPRSWHLRIRAWAGRYQQIQKALESLSEQYWQKLEDKEE
ncbi:MAG: DUF6788 family protein [bacterium]